MATADGLISELRKLARNNRKARRGFRVTIYASMGKAARILDLLEDDDALTRQFQALLSKNFSGAKETKNKTLASRVVAVVLGASGRSGQQRTSKYTRALEHLRCRGIASSDIPKQMLKQGGVEKISRSLSKNKTKHSIQVTLKSQPKSEEGEVIVKIGKNAKIDHAKGNDSDVVVGIYMKLSDLDEIREAAKGSEFRLIVARIGQPHAELQLRNMKARSRYDHHQG